MADKHIAQLAHYALGCTVVNVDVRSGKITHRFENPMRYGITDEPRNAGQDSCCSPYRQTELERHIEARGPRRNP
jgi:hypothetical protein